MLQFGTKGVRTNRPMAIDVQPERRRAHELLDQLPPAKLSAVRSLLEVMVEEDTPEELTPDDHAAIQAGLDSLEKHAPVPMEVILADFGLTVAEFEQLPDPAPNG